MANEQGFLDTLKQAIVGKSAAEESLEKFKDVIMNSPSAKDLHSYMAATGLGGDDILKGMEQAAYDIGKTRVIRDGLFPKTSLADPKAAGYIHRAAKEYERYLKDLKRNKRLALGAGLAGLLGYGVYKLVKNNEPEAMSQQQLLSKFSELTDKNFLEIMKKKSTLNNVAVTATLLSISGGEI